MIGSMENPDRKSSKMEEVLCVTLKDMSSDARACGACRVPALLMRHFLHFAGRIQTAINTNDSIN